MKPGSTIVYVPDVSAPRAVFEKAFGMQRRLLHEGGTCGEPATDETALGFAARALGGILVELCTPIGIRPTP